MPKKKPEEPVEETAGEKPAVKRPAAKAAAAKAAAAEQPPAKERAKKQPAKQPAARKAAAETAAGEQRPRDQPAQEQPAGAPQAADNPLHKKLGLRPGAAGVVVAPPEDNDNPLLPLPEGFVMVPKMDDLAPLDGPFDYMQVFARDRGDLAASFGMLRDKLAPSGSLWVSWMKQSSGRGMLGDLNENIIRRIALTNGMVDVKVAALDRNWAALRLVHRKH